MKRNATIKKMYLSPWIVTDNLGMNRPPAVLTMDIKSNDEEKLHEKKLQRKAEVEQHDPHEAHRNKTEEQHTKLNPPTEACNVEQYVNCIRLDNENKITIKNAFNLGLIDCMCEMLRIGAQEMNHLQAAGCILNVSTKIYALRVDCLFEKTLKMSCTLARNVLEDSQQVEEQRRTVMHQQKSRNKKTIATNVNSINLFKFDSDLNADSLCIKKSANLNRGHSGGVTFLSSMTLKDDSCQLVLDSDSLCSLTTSSKQDSSSNRVIIQSNSFQGLEHADICPSLKGFIFTSWNPENENLIGVLQSPSKRKLDDYQVPNLPAISDDHVFDLMGSVQDGGDYEGVFGLNPITDFGIKDIVEEEDATIEHLAWTRPATSKLAVVRDADGNEASKKRRTNVPLVLDFQNIPDLDQHFVLAESIDSIKFRQETLLKWPTHKIILHEEVKFYPSNDFYQLFTRPLLSIQQQKDAISASLNLRGILSSCDYENHKDTENFCQIGSDSTSLDSRLDAKGTRNVPQEVTTSKMITTWQMNYPRTAEKMDMKRLKSTIWNILSYQTDGDSNCKPEKSKLKYFSTTYKQIPNLLPHRAADNLSVPLAFAAILQLANENNLVLQQIYGNLGDFVILNHKKI